MSKSSEEIILALMQNVSDKLDTISNEISQIKPKNKKETLPSESNLLNEILNNQKIIYSYLSTSKNQPVDKLKVTPVTNKNYKTEYIVFGKDTPFSSRLLLILIAVVLISIPVFKHLPTYINERSTLKKERDTYRLFYNSEFLKSFDQEKVIPYNIVNTLNLVKSRDSAFINELEILNDKYSTYLKKEELKAELKKLQE